MVKIEKIFPGGAASTCEVLKVTLPDLKRLNDEVRLCVFNALTPANVRTSAGWIRAGVCGRNLPARSHSPARCGHHPESLQQQGQGPHGVHGQSPQEPEGSLNLICQEPKRPAADLRSAVSANVTGSPLKDEACPEDLPARTTCGPSVVQHDHQQVAGTSCPVTRELVADARAVPLNTVKSTIKLHSRKLLKP